MEKTRLKTPEIWGAIFVFFVAIFFHFVYDWSNNAIWTIFFSAVNESVYEHIKIFAVAFFLWSIVEYFILKPEFYNFVAIKTFSLWFLILAIPTLFYTYTGILGENFLWLDILTSIISVAISFYISYKNRISEGNLKKYFPVSLFLLIIFLIALINFSFAPPKIDLFKDPISGTYGLAAAERCDKENCDFCFCD